MLVEEQGRANYVKILDLGLAQVLERVAVDVLDGGHGIGPSGQPRTNSVASGSSPTWRLQWPCTAGSKDAPAGSTSAE